jgi:hypothetical protein
MCTLSFIPKSNGYLLGMNRDEKIARGHGFPPYVRRLSSKDVLFPSEEDGRTWIGGNQYGIALALLNWNIPYLRQRVRRSRGLIIPELLSSTNSAEIDGGLTSYEARECAPFRLLAVIPNERTLLELSWDGGHISRKTSSWQIRHWFSSSASDARAEQMRGGVCSRSSSETNAGSAAWLRQLHRSHENGPGAFSLCVHREGVETLSYTEISCTRVKVSMVHTIGSPCHPHETHMIEIPRLHSEVSATTLGERQRIEGTDGFRV